MRLQRSRGVRRGRKLDRSINLGWHGLRATDRRPRWHLVYFALAAFDLLAVLISLGLNHHLATLYDELRALARRFMRPERSDHTLEPTGLVHEAYVRLHSGAPVEWQGRTHFMAVAARAMRRVLPRM